ncbi:MAG: bifunctional DedA family/phosphatase PAP2 family protein [bacterium]|nr:bifunctional DedA family/phosphatase PAP2 family protein [bacterium]
MDFGALYLELRSWLIVHPDAILVCVFLLSMIEAIAVIGIIVPAVPVLFVLSLLAAHAEIPLLPLFASAIAGAMTGDGVSYTLGHGFKHRIEGFWPFSRYPAWLQSAEAFVEKHGGKSIIFGRFIGPLRSFVPMAAGIFHMKPLYFLWMNFLSALAWAPFHLLPGYSLGAAAAHDWLPGRPQLLLVAALLILVAVLAWLLPALDGWRRRRTGKYPLANSGRCLAIDGHPEDQRAALRLGLFAFTGFALLAGLLPWLKPLDMNLSSQLFALRQNALDPLFVVLSLLGDKRGLLVFGGVVTGWLALRKEWNTVVLALLVSALCLALPTLFKLLFSIPRPMLVMSPPESWSFPSGHAFSAVMVWGFVLVFLERYGRAGIMGIARPILFILILFTVASRSYLGVHWLSDVLGGALLGLACLAGMRWLWYRRAPPTLPLLEVIMLLLLALALSAGLEVFPRYTESLLNYQPLPGVLPGYFLLP